MQIKPALTKLVDKFKAAGEEDRPRMVVAKAVGKLVADYLGEPAAKVSINEDLIEYEVFVDVNVKKGDAKKKFAAIQNLYVGGKDDEDCRLGKGYPFMQINDDTVVIYLNPFLVTE